jgi:O-antigen/teichoic acid export membrane protein
MKLKQLVRKIFSHSLARDSAIVFAGSMAANVGAYIYHFLMGRLLGPAGYGELSSLVSILYIFTVPLMVSQTVLVKFISGFKAHGEVGQAKSLFVSVTRLGIIISLVGFPLILVCSPLVTSFLHLSSTTLFFLVYLQFVFSLLTVATASMIQGYQKFVWFSIFSASAVLIKLVLSVPLASWGVFGVLVAAAVSCVILYILYYIPLRFILRVKSKPTNLTKREAITFAVPTLLTLLGVTSIYSTDIILVRHYFPAGDAGLYAALAILGKTIFYASSSVALVLFPVLSEQVAKGKASKKIIGSAIGAVAFVSFGLAFVYFLFPNFIVSMLFGNAYSQAGSLLGLFALFIAFYSVGYIISTICLAIGKTGIWIVPTVCAITQIAAIVLFHGSIGTVIMVNIAVSVLLAVGTLGYYLRGDRTYA